MSLIETLSDEKNSFLSRREIICDFKGLGGKLKNLEAIEMITKEFKLDGKIEQMLSVAQPVIFDCVVDKTENCYPMIPSGKPHNQMLLGKQDEEDEISEEGKVLV